MLCLSEVSSGTVGIQASRDKATSGSSAVPSGNKSEIHFVINFPNGDKPKNARHSERCASLVSKLLEQVVVEGEVRHVVQTVGVEVLHVVALLILEDFLKSFLDSLREVQLVAEVE